MMRRMVSVPARGRSRVLPFVAAVALVVVTSIAAYSGKVPAFVASHGIDKVVHAAMGAVLTFSLARVLRGRAVLAAVLVLVPLATDEYLQRYSPMRSSDWGDLAADVAGALLAVAIVRSSLTASASRRRAHADLPRRGDSCDPS